MKTKIFWIAFITALLLVGGFYALNAYIYKEKQGPNLPSDFKEVSFGIGREVVTLRDGVAESQNPLTDSASLNTVRYFGNELEHDIDGDGDLDVVFLVIQETGGSGIFFYVVGALNTPNGYEGTRAMLLGDRIAPQTTEPGKGTWVIVNYADRAADEPMGVRPSIAKSMVLRYSPETRDFGEVVQDFEGESALPVTELPNSDDTYISHTFTCESGDTAEVAYPVGSDQATLVLEGDMAYALTATMAASGARYANDDESIIFWEHQGEARVEVDGALPYGNCTLVE